MGIVYHGSKSHGIKQLLPMKSTHGVYVYATPDKALAVHFSGRCGDDLTYDIGHFNTDKNGPWELVENIPGAFEKMYSNSSSIYSFQDDTFKHIDTGFNEVVSSVPVRVISEEYYENVYDAIKKLEQEGLLKVYRYPNKPVTMKKDGSDILDKWRHYRDKYHKKFSKSEFDRLVCLHPSLMDKINSLARELNYDYRYYPIDLIKLFKSRIEKQLQNINHEQYIDSSYISICSSFPELSPQINKLYEDYKNSYNELVNSKVKVM